MINTIEQYKALARSLNMSLTPLTDLKILKEARNRLDIPEAPRNMDGWAARRNLEAKATGAKV